MSLREPAGAPAFALGGRTRRADNQEMRAGAALVVLGLCALALTGCGGTTRPSADTPRIVRIEKLTGSVARFGSSQGYPLYGVRLRATVCTGSDAEIYPDFTIDDPIPPNTRAESSSSAIHGAATASPSRSGRRGRMQRSAWRFSAAGSVELPPSRPLLS